MSCDLAQQIAVRFNFHKIAPLGIEDNDYRRIAMALDISQSDVEELCSKYKLQDAETASSFNKKAPQLKRKVRICYIGDSITSERTSHMNIVRTFFENEKNVEFLDCAISGWKSSDAIFEFENRVIAFHPDIIHIMIGTNDARNAQPGRDTSTASLSEYRRNIELLLEYAQRLNAKVIVTTVPPTKTAQPLVNGQVPKWETKAFNSILREVCKGKNVLLNDMEDLLSSQLDKIIDNFDNVHLNGYGQKLIAERVLSDLIEIMEGCNTHE